MTAISDYLENKLGDHILRNTAFTSPGTNVFVSLYVNDPTDADSGTEVSGNAYARLQVTVWDVFVNGVTQNTNAITFAAASGGAWGTISHVGIHDALTVGNLLFHGALDSTVVINDTDVFEMLAGQLTVSLA